MCKRKVFGRENFAARAWRNSPILGNLTHKSIPDRQQCVQFRLHQPKAVCGGPHQEYPVSASVRPCQFPVRLPYMGQDLECVISKTTTIRRHHVRTVIDYFSTCPRIQQLCRHVVSVVNNYTEPETQFSKISNYIFVTFFASFLLFSK